MAAFLLPLLLAAFCMGMAQTLLLNTLANNGRWVSTKDELGMGAMGASLYMRDTQALEGCRLNLHKWHGNQELTTKPPMRIDAADFDFKMGDGTYFSLVFRAPGHYSGLRLSVNPALKSIYFTAREDGEFLTQHELDLPPIPVNRWNHFHFHRDAGLASVEINGHTVDILALPLPPLVHPGFRGCGQPVSIDNVRFLEHYRPVLEDSFFNRQDLPRNFFFGLLIAAGLAAAYIYCHYLIRPLDMQSVVAAIAFNVAAAFIAVLGLLWVYLSMGNHPARPALLAAEKELAQAGWRWRDDQILAQAQACEATGERIVLMVGASQVLGEGANTQDETFVARVQQRLAALDLNPPYRCINAGIAGANSVSIVEHYEFLWLQMKPAIVVIMLGLNEDRASKAVFEANLEKLIALNAEHKIPTVLVLDPYSAEWAEFAMRDAVESAIRSHAAVRVAAARHQLPIVDAHAQLDQARDKGFVWWDYCHPTSFGHRLLGDAVFDEVQKLLRE